MTDQSHEERAYFEWTLYLAQMRRDATVRDAFRAAWQARGEYERARVAAAEAQNARLVAALELANDRAVKSLEWASKRNSAQEAWELLSVYVMEIRDLTRAALAGGPGATDGASAEARHESWCAGSGGECSCDAPEFGPHD